MDINLSSQIVVQTAAQWAADNTVYSNKRILVTSDAFYGSTDQRKFKIADGTQTWTNLNYMPIGQTLAEVLANGSNTNAVSFKSPNSLTELLVANNNIDAYVDNGFDVSEINMTPTTIGISTTGASIDLTATSVTKNTKEILTEDNITQVITNGVTDKAPSEDAVFDALALKLSKSSSVQFGHTALSPVDNASYFFAPSGLSAQGAASIASRRLPSTMTGFITRVSVQIGVAGTLGTTEQAILKINNVTAGTSVTIFTTMQYDLVGKIYSLTLPSMFAVTIGDSLEVEVDCPTWVTNPTSVTHYVIADIDAF